MSELQKAVSDAERKAHEMISAERSKMERALAEAKRQASEDALTVINQQEDSSEVSTTDPSPTFHHIHSLSGFPLCNALLFHPSLLILFPLVHPVLCNPHSWLLLVLVLQHVVMIIAEAVQLSGYIKADIPRWLEQSARLRPLQSGWPPPAGNTNQWLWTWTQSLKIKFLRQEKHLESDK